MAYAVVEFPKEAEVDVDYEKQCMWPALKSTTKVQLTVKNADLTTAEFRKLPVRLLYKAYQNFHIVY